MGKNKEVATLFKIKRISEDLEQLIPFDVVEGTYDIEDYTFTTSDGTVYSHIEETEFPNIGYANRHKISCFSDTEEDIEKEIKDKKINKLQDEIETKYVRFITEKNRIYKKTKHEAISNILFDMDSRRYHEQIAEYRKNDSCLEITLTPQEIYEKVRKTIKGQDQAIITIATCLWATMNDRRLTKKQMLLVGPTGVGKTAIFKKMEQILNVPVVIFSVPGLSQAGYVGRSTDEILKQIYYECDENIDIAEHAIVLLDEIDKISFNKDLTTADVSTVGVQNELLKMVEGCTRVVEINNGDDTFTIDTSNIIFICSGAFQEIFEPKKEITIGGFNTKKLDEPKTSSELKPEDLIKYGLKRELVGRFPIIVQLDSLTKDIFREILLESDESELLAHVSFLESLGVEVSNLEQIIDLIIENAISNKIGARGLVTTISKLFTKAIYEIANNPNKYNEVILGTNIIQDPYDFELIEKTTKTKVRIENKKG